MDDGKDGRRRSTRLSGSPQYFSDPDIFNVGSNRQKDKAMKENFGTIKNKKKKALGFAEIFFCLSTPFPFPRFPNCLKQYLFHDLS